MKTTKSHSLKAITVILAFVLLMSLCNFGVALAADESATSVLVDSEDSPSDTTTPKPDSNTLSNEDNSTSGKQDDDPTAVVENVTTPDGIVFDESTGTITDYVGSASTLDIPSTINGVSVIEHIGD